MKSPKPNQKHTNPTPPHQKSSDAELAQINPKITRFNTTDPNPTGQKQGRSKIRELKQCQPHPAHRTKQMTRLVIGIQPRHHRHTPKHRHPPHSAQKAGDTHPRNKSTLAHYRVLKQHQHTHQPDQHSPASQAASLQATHNTNQKSNSRSTTVYPAVTLCSFTIPPDQPLGPLRSNGWISNHEP